MPNDQLNGSEKKIQKQAQTHMGTKFVTKWHLKSVGER